MGCLLYFVSILETIDRVRMEPQFRITILSATESILMWHIGYNDQDNEGTFVWPHLGTTGDYTHWYDGEPNNAGNEDCGQIGIYWDLESPYHWNDIRCSAPRAYICEGLPSTG